MNTMRLFDQHHRIILHKAQVASYKALHIMNQSLPFWVISHIREGRVEMRTGGMIPTVQSGTVMVHPPLVPFSELADEPGTHEFLFLDANSSASVELLRLHPVALTVRLSAPAAWSKTFDHLMQAIASRRLIAFGLTSQLLSTVVEDWEAAGSVPRPASLQTPADRFACLVQYMMEHLGERIERNALAAQSCLHPGSFNRAFRIAYGTTPMRLLRDLRLSHALQLLETSDDTLETIASRCGFEDPTYFSRTFRACYGLPPGRFRQRLREGVKNASIRYSGPLRLPPPPLIIKALNPAGAEGEG